MVVVQINLSCLWGSTGKICDSISKILTQKGIENYIFYTYGENPENHKNYIKYGNLFYNKFQALKSRILGNYGFNSNFATRVLIKKLEEIKPNIVHIHNIHGHDCNFEMLFNYLKSKKIKVFYTFHDCWTFTGYCPHFTMSKCNNWQKGCKNCVLKKKYSWFFDNSSRNLFRKINSLKGLDLTIITPSQWLADLVKKSSIKEYPIIVIRNGIDLSIFKPMKSDFKEKYNLIGKNIILGVATWWGKEKGLDVFIKLAKDLPPEYKIVLVGTNTKIDKQLPSNILSIHHTQNQQELAEIYSAADLFVNPTREETYPTVNMEALACGTPVLTFKTGGSPEIIDKSCGSVIDCNNFDALKAEIIQICTKKIYLQEDCIKKAKSFDKTSKFNEYIELYKNT